MIRNREKKRKKTKLVGKTKREKNVNDVRMDREGETTPGATQTNDERTKQDRIQKIVHTSNTSICEMHMHRKRVHWSIDRWID